MKLILVLLLLTLFSFQDYSNVFPQVPNSTKNRSYEKEAEAIIAAGLKDRMAFKFLEELCKKIGPRLVGSTQAAKAVEWGKKTMEDLGFQNVRLEPVTVPRWVRGTEDGTIILTSGENIPIKICALGGSIGTPDDGITAEVIQVKSFNELSSLGDVVKGKIVFFNRSMEPTKFNTFQAYGEAVDQRSSGAIEAARFGGIAALVRSLTMRVDDVPHTGAMHYVDTIPNIPAAAISLIGANILDSLLELEKNLKVKIKLECQTLPDVESANVVGEITGSEKPNEIIVIGGHLDSWDKGQGAHDDGAGCVQSIGALRILKELGLSPKRTIRAVLFMNEEFGLSGGIAYANKERPGEKHIAAIEADMGGFSPRGFGVSADSVFFNKILGFSYLLDQIDAGRITKGGGGADISELGRKGVVTIGLRVDNQRYFDYHHSDNDVIDAVNDRELELGAIALAILSYVIAQEGI